MTGYYEIIEWDKHQHYKKRNPPWIKLYQNTLISKTWIMGDNDSRVLMVASMIIASRTGNKISDDLEYIKRVANLPKKPNFKHLLAVGFIRHIDDDSNSLATDTQSACLETETETETKQRQNKNAQKPRSPSFEDQLLLLLNEGIPDQTARDFLLLRKDRRAKLTQTGLKRLKGEASKAGIPLVEALEMCCANGWQGFKAEWLKNKTKTVEPDYSKVDYGESRKL